MTSVFDLLKKHLAQHIRFDDVQFEVFCKRFKVKQTSRNEILLFGSEICPYMYFVNRGCLRIYMLDEAGRESTRFFVFEGKFGTAFPSFILQEPSMAYIQSLEPSELLYINYPDLQELINKFPNFEKAYLINLEMEYISSIKRIESLISMDANSRYQLLLKDSPALIKRLPSKIIADYLGISQETLSRLKSKK